MIKIMKSMKFAACLLFTALAIILVSCSSGTSIGTGTENTVNSNDGYEDGGIGSADNHREDTGALGEAAKGMGNAMNDAKNAVENGMNNAKNAVEENFGVNSKDAGGNATANY